MTSIKNTLKKYHKKQQIKRQIAQIYYKKLIKASLLISIVPIMVIAVLIIYARLTFFEGLIGAVAVFFGSTFFAKPYLDDLSSLTSYVENLAHGQNLAAPPLSFLGNVDELSQSVKNLHTSWGKRNIELEAALAESSILFDTIPDILLMLDRNFKIVRANNAAMTIFNKSLIGKKIRQLNPTTNFMAAVKSVFKDETSISFETSFRTNNVTQEYLVMIEKFPVQSIAGISIVIIMHNITESKIRKQMLKDFVSNASHEIRTPLTSVIGFLENLITIEDEGGDKAANKKTRKKFLAIMAEQTDRMSKLVEDLLSLSKVEINEGTTPSEVVNLTNIIKELKKRLKYLADEKGMKITFKDPKNLPDIVGDASELTQVFTNLISNAVKYGYPNTTIEITANTTTKFDNSEYIPRDCTKLLLISVKDEGEGIDDEHLPRITERFYRVDKARSRKVGGTGLGLAIAKHIIYRHRGDIVIESEPGKGSTFTVRLPVPNNSMGLSKET
jgi:two-component system phosphate regulon sensor histidine kinase PhoR